jgi:hypothetical protein
MSLGGQGQVMKFKSTQKWVRSSISTQIQKRIVWKKDSADRIFCSSLRRNQELIICRRQAQFLSSLSQCLYETDWRTASLPVLKQNWPPGTWHGSSSQEGFFCGKCYVSFPNYGIFPANYIHGHCSNAFHPNHARIYFRFYERFRQYACAYEL